MSITISVAATRKGEVSRPIGPFCSLDIANLARTIGPHFTRSAVLDNQDPLICHAVNGSFGLQVEPNRRQKHAYADDDEWNEEKAAHLKQVKKQVKDKTRRNRLNLLIDEGNQILMELNLALIDFTAKVRSNPHMDRQEYEKLQAEFRVKRVEAMKALAATRLKMRSFATEEEWNRLFTVKIKSQKAELMPLPDTESIEQEVTS